MLGGMHSLEFERIEDTGEESSFVARRWPLRYIPKDVRSRLDRASSEEEKQAILEFYRPVLVVVYSDNFAVSGIFREAIAIHKLLRKLFKFSEEANYHLTDIVGLEREVGLHNGRKALLVHQTEYAKHLVKDYEARHFGGKSLPGVDTPVPLKESDDPDVAPMKVPALKEFCAEIGGKLV